MHFALAGPQQVWGGRTVVTAVLFWEEGPSHWFTLTGLPGDANDMIAAFANDKGSMVHARRERPKDPAGAVSLSFHVSFVLDCAQTVRQRRQRQRWAFTHS